MAVIETQVTPWRGRRPLHFFLMLAAICAIFASGISGHVIMDDLVLSSLGNLPLTSWTDAWLFVQDHQSRHVSIASFALQAKLLGADPAVSRIINIGIHAANALLAGRVAQLSARHSGYADLAPEFGAATALIWAALPIHATAVLYPIQRMTLLGATGSLAVFILVLGPLTAFRLVLATGIYALAIASKENAILAMPAAFLFRGLLTGTAPHPRNLYLLLMGGSGAFIAFILLWNAELEEALRYSAWDFSLVERMLLAPAVLTEYAVATLLPLPQDFSFYYDDYLEGISRPLNHFYLLMLVAAPTVFLALYKWAEHNRLAAAGAALFILLHVVESTALAIDLYFEHRNYLPAIGLAISLIAILMHRRTFTSGKKLTLAAYFAFLLCTLGYRSSVIGDEIALTRHHLAHHPTSFRSIADAAAFGVEIPAEVFRRFPHPIELQAISLRKECIGAPPLHELPKTLGPVPKRSLRLHADTLRLCADPCRVPERYLLRLANAYLLNGRIDSYRVRFERQLMEMQERRREKKCPSSRQ